MGPADEKKIQNEVLPAVCWIIDLFHNLTRHSRENTDALMMAAFHLREVLLLFHAVA